IDLDVVLAQCVDEFLREGGAEGAKFLHERQEVGFVPTRVGVCNNRARRGQLQWTLGWRPAFMKDGFDGKATFTYLDQGHRVLRYCLLMPASAATAVHFLSS